MDKISKKSKNNLGKESKVLDSIKNIKSNKQLKDIVKLLSEKVQDDNDDGYPHYTNVIKNINGLINLIKSDCSMKLKSKIITKEHDNPTRHLGYNYEVVNDNKIVLNEALYNPGCLDNRTKIELTFERFSEEESFLRKLKSSDTELYNKWEWGKIHDHIEEQVNREDYGIRTSEVAIKELKYIDKSYSETSELNSGKYYIVSETSRGSKLFKKYIPKKVLPLFKDLISKADADGTYRSYNIIKYINN